MFSAILLVMSSEKSRKAAGYVWIVAGLALIVLSLLAAFHWQLPGVDFLLNLMSKATGPYLYLAAFVAIIIEGIYFVGNFFPGSTIVILLAILSQGSGSLSFLAVVLTVFIGWSLAGLINIYLAKHYRNKILTKINEAEEEFEIKDRPWTTWFPAFRANYEVTQIIEGGDPKKVFFSSLRVKAWACGGASLYTLVFPYLVNIDEISNEAGFLSLIPIALIMCVVGFWKLWQHPKLDFSSD